MAACQLMSMFSMLVSMLLLVAPALGAIEEIDDGRALTFQIKTNDAVVVGIFDSKGSADEKLYRSVAGGLEGNGIVFAVCYDAKVAKKYLKGGEDPEGAPAVAVFTNFDPETGHSKKHVKGKAFTTIGEPAALYKFIFAEALPVITRIPFNMGPDAGRRKQVRQPRHPPPSARACLERAAAVLLPRQPAWR